MTSKGNLLLWTGGVRYKLKYITQTLFKAVGALWEWTDEVPGGGNATATLARRPVSQERNALTATSPYSASAPYQ